MPVMQVPLLILVTIIAPSLQQCDPSMCVLPYCRCQMDKNPPGGLQVNETPQMIIVTMQGAINSDTVQNYQPLFNSIVNPNGCPVRGTFFVEDLNSDYRVIKNLYSEGHEIGIQSVDGTTPTGATDWISMYKTVLNQLTVVGVNQTDVNGARTPGTSLGGDEELIGMGNNNIQYDSSCSSAALSTKGTYLWPYTFDYPTTDCDAGSAPTIAFKGKWEIPVADLHGIPGDRYPCVAPSACQGVRNKKDAFDLFYHPFQDHYAGNRTPFLLVVDPAWAKNTEFLQGTVEFLEYARAAFGDSVWIVSAFKALQWVQRPTIIANLSTFAPWGCS